MKTVIEMAEDVGALGYVRDSGKKPHQWIFTPKELERFAALVIANHPPQSFMTWQEGYEAGKQAEREACAKVCESTAWTSSIEEWRDMTKKDVASKSMLACAAAIRARGQA